MSAARRVLVVTAVAAERDAFTTGLGPAADGRFVVLAGGVGPSAGIAAAGALAAGAPAGAPGAGAPGAGPGIGMPGVGTPGIGTPEPLPFDVVICAGIAGGFADRVAVGGLVVADRVVAADLGAQDADGGFLALDELGLGPSTIDCDPGLADGLAAALAGQISSPAVARGSVLTVATVTGTAARAAELARRWDPVAEAMEGYPIALAAAAHGVPFGEVRAVSNTVGPRDRNAWDLPAAFAALTAAATTLLGW